MFLREAYRVLSPGGVCVMTGEPTRSALFLEGLIMSTLVKITSLFRKKRSQRPKCKKLTDIWLYEKESLTSMLSEVGFTEIKIKPFGFFSALLNGPSSIFFSVIFRKSMQPDFYWKIVTIIDHNLFFWLPAKFHSHFVIAARKPLSD